jgi:eukaryotic-like serine/threonine-protein kinase
VLANVAMRLSELHAGGFVHRDLKPANVMWLPRENRWTVIDYGCAARSGESAPLLFTLVYAAPEVLRALKDGQDAIIADPALDAWSLGVMAFELLSKEPAFHVLADGKQEVCALT